MWVITIPIRTNSSNPKRREKTSCKIFSIFYPSSRTGQSSSN